MAINKNHPFEDINGVKCAVVETGIPQARVDFIKPLLEFNGYEVLVGEAPPPKAAPAPKPAAPAPAAATDAVNSAAEATPVVPAAPAPEAPPPPPALFTVGVTNVMFNATNAVFGRLLKTPDGHVVTQAYWLQKEQVSDDETPYYEKRALFA
jgi:hypothetical protein